MVEPEMIEINGAEGEGGGQIIRTALSLSLLTGRPFTIEQVRGGRRKPGLLRQHLTAVRAAARIGAAEVEGDHLGSDRLVFRPQGLVAGHYDLAIGSAGSANLVVQTLLPALLNADQPSHVSVSGGTHNPASPSFDYLDQVFLPVVERMGAQVKRTMHAPGFFPAGGGRISFDITPVPLSPITLDTRPEDITWHAQVLIAHLPAHVAEREVSQLAEGMSLRPEAVQVVNLDAQSAGPGNAVILTARAGDVVEQFTGFGRKGVKAEVVVDEVVAEARAWLGSGAPVGPHLADQLILPMALAGGGRFVTQAPQQHTLTQVKTVGRFLDIAIDLQHNDDETAGRTWTLTVGDGRALGDAS
ncbi:MAG: RNA 3'-terminal phosphate cyclase [Bradymonadia bacterium]